MQPMNSTSWRLDFDLSEKQHSLLKVVCGAGCPPWPPARPIRPIDLRARPVRIKRALTDCHGKSDLPCPRWLPPGPPRRQASGRGRNGAYGMSSANSVGDNRKAGVDRKDGWARTCTGHEHVGHQFKGTNLRAPT
jgi:hypothetical protein